MTREITAAAEERLRDGEIDLVIVAPGDAVEEPRGRQTTIRVSGTRSTRLRPARRRRHLDLVSQPQRRTIEAAAAEGIAFAEARSARGGRRRPDPRSSPAHDGRDGQRRADRAVRGHRLRPAGVLLVVQHMARTLSALSLVREKLSGQMELFRGRPSARPSWSSASTSGSSSPAA